MSTQPGVTSLPEASTSRVPEDEEVPLTTSAMRPSFTQTAQQRQTDGHR